MSAQIKDAPRPKSKRELVQLLEDSERRNRAFKNTLEAAEAQLAKYKPKGQTYELTARGTFWQHLSWERAREIAQKCLEAGVPIDIRFEPRDC